MIDEMFFYRYDASITEEGFVYVHPYQFQIKRRTKKSVVLDVFGKEVRCLLGAKKSYAYPTRELAYFSLLRRCELREAYARQAHENATEILDYVRRKMPIQHIVAREVATYGAIE